VETDIIFFSGEPASPVLPIADSKRWCRTGLAPRLMHLGCMLERYPADPRWDRRGSASSERREAATIATFVIMRCCAPGVYGISQRRSAMLRLDDLDSGTRTIAFAIQSSGKSHGTPWYARSDASRTISAGTPQTSASRSFLTLKHPHQPLSGGGLVTMVRKRMQRLGLKLHSYGAHTLRHACVLIC